MDSVRINSGEYIASKIYRIQSIPHVSILTERRQTPDVPDFNPLYARDMIASLTETYHHYKEGAYATGAVPDLALEITWVSRPVTNQTFNAAIDLYVVTRGIGPTAARAEDDVERLSKIIATTLKTQKYEVSEITLGEFTRQLPSTGPTAMEAIVKEERVDTLPTGYLPHCYAFDVLPEEYGDLSRLASILIATPGVAVTFQLIPVHYTDAELSDLSVTDQQLSMLNTGIADRQVGNLRINAAERISALYNYYNSNRTRPLFTYNILVYGQTQGVSNVSARIIGQLSGSGQQQSNLRSVALTPSGILSGENAVSAMPWVAAECIINTSRNAQIWQSGAISQSFYRLPFIITADEAATFFRLPIADEKVHAGFNVNESTVTNRTYSRNLINSGDIALGELKSATGNTIGLSLSDLAKHILIVGTPGSGKTTFSVSLLDRLWKEHGIPFLVIEPAKNEYRALLQSIPELNIFTPGKNSVSPFVFNPFVPPTNVRLETYKSTLKTAFAAGVSMSTPLDKIFEEAVNNCYSDHRWLDTYTSANKGRIFNISDFIKCFRETFDEIGYTGDARNIGRAGIVRLRSLKNLFDNYQSIPIEDILSRPTVIELSAIENADQKALIIALLLLSILAYVNANYVGEGGLRNFILLEEAHVLLDSDTTVEEGAANPAAIAQKLLKRMLAEIRSYGVGLGIADQSPRKVGIDVVALTDIKMAFRLVEGTDKDILGDSIGLNDTQRTRLARLRPGEAFLFFNHLDEPEEIVTPDYRMNNNISISLSDDTVRRLSTYWETHGEMLRPYPECVKTPYCSRSCCYERRILGAEVARRLHKRYIGAGCKDAEKLKTLLAGISNRIKEELNDEPFSRELLSCVKVHLWRHIKYDTLIKVPTDIIENSLLKP